MVIRPVASIARRAIGDVGSHVSDLAHELSKLGIDFGDQRESCQSKRSDAGDLGLRETNAVKVFIGNREMDDDSRVVLVGRAGDIAGRAGVK